MSKIIGVDTANIDNISGLGTGAGGISPVPATTDSGIVVCPTNVSLQFPYSSAEFSAYSNPIHMYQLSSLTGVAELGHGTWAWGALLSNGDLYTGGGTNSVSADADAMALRISYGF